MKMPKMHIVFERIEGLGEELEVVEMVEQVEKQLCFCFNIFLYETKKLTATANFIQRIHHHGERVSLQSWTGGLTAIFTGIVELKTPRCISINGSASVALSILINEGEGAATTA